MWPHVHCFETEEIEQLALFFGEKGELPGTPLRGHFTHMGPMKRMLAPSCILRTSSHSLWTGGVAGETG